MNMRALPPSRTSPARPGLTIRNSTAVWGWLICGAFILGCTGMSWLVLNERVPDGTSPALMGAINLVFWAAGLFAASRVFAEPVIVLRVHADGITVDSYWLWKRVRTHHAKERIREVRIHESADSEGDPYFTASVVLDDGAMIPIAEGHSRRHCEQARTVLLNACPLRPIGAWLAAVALAVSFLPCGSAHGAQTHATDADADHAATHLERGLAYLEQGEPAQALLEFEQVLRFDNLPADLSQRAEIYARAARSYRAGSRLSGFGFAETGGGYYRENVTRTTNALGGNPARDWFWEARVGGGLGYVLGEDLMIDGGLDYLFRHYDDSGRCNDSDLRWNGAVIQSLDEGSRSIGVRGEASYRGEDGYRQDYGLFANRYFALDPHNQISLEGEIRTRRYPAGNERQYSRDTGEIWLGWTRALVDGKASATITLNVGREWATRDRPAGDQTFYGVAFDWGMDFDERLGVFLAGLWEHNGYHEDIAVDDESEPGRELSPDLDIYEIGGGLTYEVAPGWSLRPEVLHVRDEGDTPYSDYSATEFWLILRASF